MILKSLSAKLGMNFGVNVGKLIGIGQKTGVPRYDPENKQFQ